MKITTHAKTRSKGRNGWNEKTTERMIQKVLEKGIRHSQTKGRLHKWMSGLYDRHRRKGTDIRLYGDKAYIFANDSLITVIQIPPNLTRDMDKLVCKDRDEN